jgi:hypothetical protein
MSSGRSDLPAWGKNVAVIFSAEQATGCDTSEEIAAGFASSLPEVQDDSLTRLRELGVRCGGTAAAQ